MAKKTQGIDLLVDNKVIITDMRRKDQLMQKGFGEFEAGKLVLDMKEAVYLTEKKKISVEDSKENALDRESLIKYASKKNKRFYRVYVVYRDMRERGYVVKTGYKFGFDLRVYPRGKKPGEEHTKWVIGVHTQDDKFSMPEFSRMVRLSGNLKTTLRIAVVDSEDDINYYEVSRVTP